MRDNIDILLIEDNPADVDLTREAFDQGKIRSKLHVAMDGVEALRFLRREDEHASAPRPHLILLDLNLPKKDGRTVLAEIKEDPRLRSIPVVILTSSDAEDDVTRSYDLHANCYVQKPSNFSHFLSIVSALENFWFTVVRYPSSF